MRRGLAIVWGVSLLLGGALVAPVDAVDEIVIGFQCDRTGPATPMSSRSPPPTGRRWRAR